MTNRFLNELRLSGVRRIYRLVINGGRFSRSKQFQLCLTNKQKLSKTFFVQKPRHLKHPSKNPYLVLKFESYSHQSLTSLPIFFFLFYTMLRKKYANKMNGHSLNNVIRRNKETLIFHVSFVTLPECRLFVTIFTASWIILALNNKLHKLKLNMVGRKFSH